MSTVYVMQGLPASGKSTAARELAATGVLRFSLDDFRAMAGVGRETWTDDAERIMVGAMIASAKIALKAGRDVVIDNTHLVPRLPRMYRKEFSRLDVEFKVISLADVSLDKCIMRDAERESGVGEAVIRKLHNTYVGAGMHGWKLTDKWLNGMPYQHPTPYAGDHDKPYVVLCDIDGTLALHEGVRGPYEYNRVAFDRPNENVVKVAQDLDDIYGVIFMSGREHSCYQDTYDWLLENEFRDPTILMRKTGDKRPDYIVKQELFDAHIRGKYDVLCVLDDRNQVVDMWREMGLTCLQVAEGDF